MIAHWEALADMPASSGHLTTVWHEVPCPACGSGDAEPVLQAPSWQEPVARIYAITRCQACGVWYTNPLPGGLAACRSQADSFSSTHSRSSSVIAAQLGKAPVRGSWLFHFGPAEVSLATQGQRLGWRVVLWREKPCQVPETWWLAGGLVVFGELADLPQNCSMSAAAICAWDWLERQADLPEALSVWRRMLAPQGRLVLLVPNLDSKGFRKYGSLWRGLDLPYRRVHFSLGTLCPLLTREGWRVCSARTYPCLSWLRESAQRWRQEHESSPQPWWHRWRTLLRTSLWADTVTAWSSRICGSGDWLLVVAQPRLAS